jgi:mono/diheme cytochrome c family protein
MIRVSRGVRTIALAASIAGAVDLAVPTRAADAQPTFSRDVAPIVFRRCATCHRPGEVGPMPLLSYDEVRPWARAIRRAVVAREMPPWGADPAYGRFKNDRSLPPQELRTIVAWVDAGAPRGDDRNLPPRPHFPDGWQLGTPDYVIEMPVAFQLPAEGQIDIQDFFVRVPFDEDRFVDALEIRPSAGGVLHHGGAYVVDLPAGTRLVDGRAIAPDGHRLTRDEIRGVGESVFETQGASKLISFVPGRGFEHHPPGTAKRIPAGKYIHFDMHYQPTGRPETDRTRLGLWFAKTPVVHEVLTRTVSAHIIVEGREAPVEVIRVGGQPRITELIPTIPPYAENWKIVTVMPLQAAATIYALSPHMHLRGKDMTYIVTYPDGQDEILLRVPRYDFHWQFNYELETPIHVPAGSKIVAIAHYDNSARNPYNPAPEKQVFWSEQSWDEMDVAMVQMSFDVTTTDR